MTRTGRGKVAPKKGVDKTQFGIEGVLVSEILKDLNGKINIIGAKVIVGKGFNKHNIPVTAKLRMLNVETLREHRPGTEATITFDQTTKSNIKDKVAKVCKLIDAEPKAAYFRYLTISNGKGNGKFKRCSKDIKEDSADRRKKLTVLGLYDATGDIKSLISDIGAKKYVCNIKVEEVPFITCSRS